MLHILISTNIPSQYSQFFDIKKKLLNDLKFLICWCIYIFIDTILAVALPPSPPEVVEGNERSMTIKWKAPIDDGGLPITSYNIEARTTGGDWQTWEMLDNPSTRAVVQKLQKGMEYQFRYDTFF